MSTQMSEITEHGGSTGQVTGISGGRPTTRRSGHAGPLSRVWTAVRRFHDEQLELQERLLLINRPWEEDYLHLAWNGDSWELHGTVPPPAHGQHSVTRWGWCPGVGSQHLHA